MLAVAAWTIIVTDNAWGVPVRGKQDGVQALVRVSFSGRAPWMWLQKVTIMEIHSFLAFLSSACFTIHDVILDRLLRSISFLI